MKNFLINYSYSIYLGFSLSMFLDAKWYKWEYYAVMIPVVFLVELKVKNREEEK